MNTSAISNVKKLIKAGKTNNGAWDDSDATIDDYKQFAIFIDDSKDPNTKTAYSYLAGKQGEVYTKAVSSAMGYAIGTQGAPKNPQAAKTFEIFSNMLKKQNVTNSMKSGAPLILLNSASENPVYRVLVQTDKELPAYDMGLNKIRYDQEAINNALNGLLGQFVYDETQSAHNHQINGGQAGHKFAKVVNSGFCPEYGAYTDWEVFDKGYIPLMNQYHDSWKRGLPIREGPSTELRVKEAQKYGDNNAEVTDMEYTGVVWIDNPRDNGLGVCSVVNSIKEVLGDDNLTDKVEISKNEYDELIQAKKDKKTAEEELETLKTDYKKGEGLYERGKTAFEKIKTELGEVKDQLKPFLEAQKTEKAALINSILEEDKKADKEELEKLDFNEVKKITVINSIIKEKPAKEQEKLKTELETMSLESLEAGIKLGSIITNQGPGASPAHGVVNGGVGSGRQGGSGTGKLFKDPEKQRKYEEAQNLPSGPNNSIIVSTKKNGDD